MEPIPVLTRTDEEGNTEVVSPRIGWWWGPPSPGQLLGPGSELGVLARLGRRFRLVLPPDLHGRVVDPPHERRVVAVEYGQRLFGLAPIETGATAAAATGAEAGNPVASGGGLTVVAPTDGTFYHRPSPDASPFVEVGKPVRRGQVVGLVEVMKTFNQILFDGADRPDQATVVELRAGDGEEIRAGQTLLVLEP